MPKPQLPRDASGAPIMVSRYPSLYYNTPLGANGTYTQPWIDSTMPGFTFPNGSVWEGASGPIDINFVSGSVYADQPGTLYIDQSDDQVNIFSTSISVPASTLTDIPLTNITKRYYRFRYVNGSSAQTTFVLAQTSERIDAFSTVSLAPPTTVANTQIGTISASGLSTPNTWYYPVFQGKLTRTAKCRAISIVSTLNQSVTVKLGVYDSILGSNAVQIEAFTGTVTLSNNTGTTFGSNYDPLLTEPVDSLMVAVQTGSTAPTTGQLTIYLTERFG